MTPEDLIKQLRSALPLGPTNNDLLNTAAGGLEEWDRANKNTLADLAIAIEQRDEALAEVERLKKLLRSATICLSEYQAENERVRKLLNDFTEEKERLKAELTEAIRERNKTVAARPEPSRLEIAAMLKAGWFANRDTDFNAADHKWWIEQADALIAAAKEALE